VPLFDDCAPAMAVRTPNLTLRYLLFQHREGGLAACQLNHTSSLRPDVVEIQNDRIPFSAVDTRRIAKMVEEEEKIPAA
jgi:hypothetical protein